MSLTLEPPALNPSTIIEVPVSVYDIDKSIINTEYHGLDEKVAIAFGTVVIGIWLLRYIMAFLPFFVGLGVVIAIFALF